jgi:hypothetical protein
MRNNQIFRINDTQAQAEAARKARAEKLEKLTNLTDEQLAKLLAQVE